MGDGGGRREAQGKWWRVAKGSGERWQKAREWGRCRSGATGVRNLCGKGWKLVASPSCRVLRGAFATARSTATIRFFR